MTDKTLAAHQPQSVSDNAVSDPRMSDKERAVIEAAKAWLRVMSPSTEGGATCEHELEAAIKALEATERRE